MTKAGAGTGTVTSSPAGINCGSTCTATYANGTSVTLTATPSSRSRFSGWTGDCAGRSTCVLTMNTNHAVTATFTRKGNAAPTLRSVARIDRSAARRG